MSCALEILAESGDKQVLDADAPWVVGGHDDADVRIADAPAMPLAFIGCEGSHYFIQPATPEAGLHRNGRPVGASVWIEDGDRLLLGGYRIVCRLSEHGLRLEIVGKARAAAVAPGNGMPPAGAMGDPAVAAAPTYRPRRYAPAPKPTAYRAVRYAIFGGFGILALAVLFLLLAVPIEVVVEPAPDDLRITGFPPPITLAGQRLAIPGRYGVKARLEGYQPLDETIAVSDEKRRFDLAMEKLPGLLYLRVRPADITAWVALDGQTLGTAPLDGREVAAGQHSLRVSAERYLPDTRTVTIAGMGRKEHLDIVLKPAWAMVSIASQPPGARVILDDEEVGETPLTLEILQGAHRLKLEKTDHAPEELTINVVAGVEQTIGPVKLATLPARLSLASEPKGASFTVGERFVGRAPVDALVAPGRHEVQAMMPGYKTVKTAVTLAADETKRLRVTLEPEFGTVFVRATPADAVLEVDGEVVGPAVQRLRLQTLAHRIRVVKDGYASFEATILPKAGLSNELAIALTPLSEIEKLGLSARIVTAARQRLLLMGPGAFTMGAPRREPGRRANEREQDVALTRRFYLSETLVTNAQFRRFRPQHSSG
ncbi:MAG: PEGA domain-containing protein, partial [Alphaproteobacteria bacterium]